MLPPKAPQHRPYHAHFADEASESPQFCDLLGVTLLVGCGAGFPIYPASGCLHSRSTLDHPGLRLGCSLISSRHHEHFFPDGGAAPSLCKLSRPRRILLWQAQRPCWESCKGDTDFLAGHKEPVGPELVALGLDDGVWKCLASSLHHTKAWLPPVRKENVFKSLVPHTVCHPPCNPVEQLHRQYLSLACLVSLPLCCLI